MNEKLRSTALAGLQHQLADQIVGFDADGVCKGIVRYAGGAFLETPDAINDVTLDEARKYPTLFHIEGEDVKTDELPEIVELPQSLASYVAAGAIEVEGKAVIDAPVSDTPFSPAPVAPAPVIDVPVDVPVDVHVDESA